MVALEAPAAARNGPARVALLVGLALLGFSALRLLLVAAKALFFPYELDYGEGIVWQQMLLIFQGRSYGPIDGFPAIVFHYPPVFHAAAYALSATGLDPLSAGRLVSLLATLACALFVRAFAARLAEGRAARLCGAFAALVALAFWPVGLWAPLMRVDMLAFAFGLAGIRFGLAALRRPALVHAAALCFVAAIFTKQTAIAAPAATFLVLLLVRPRTAKAGIAACLLLGTAALAAFAFATDGGFLRHIFLYNINRADYSRLAWIAQQAALHLFFFAAASFAIVQGLAERLPGYRGAGWRAARDTLRRRPGDAAFLLLLAYFGLTSVMLVLVAKSGSSLNYFIEWMLAASVFAGLAVRDAASAARPSLIAALLPAALGAQILLLPASPSWTVSMAAARQPSLKRLEAAVHASPRPVISDDMVLVLRGGKRVMWEPAIFAELASERVWDERPFIARIRAREFGFFVTVGDRGSRLFDSRYTQAVAAAMDEAYPRRRLIAGYVVHLPAEARGD
ncbi:MAG: hypothetical protein QOH04_1451 [Sphingomonadales bacterium]|jgi:hypothetical protein|nr:hypothetical protein [Sphingomonadales bacterium]